MGAGEEMTDEKTYDKSGVRSDGPPKLRLVTSEGEPSLEPPARGDEAEMGSAFAADVLSAAAPWSDPMEGDEAARDRQEKIRILEALLFSTSQSMTVQKLAEFLPPGEDPLPLLIELQARYASCGVNLVRVAGRWSFRTAPDLSYLLQREINEERRLSKAALETLAIIAYHQPVTRAEIEEIRGVSTSAGTLDILLETTWIRPRGRRRAPGRPVTYGTTDAFLDHFGMDSVRELPGLSDLRGSGLLTSQLPADFAVPQPSDVAALMPDEMPLEDEDEEAQADLALESEDEAEELEALRSEDEADKPVRSSDS